MKITAVIFILASHTYASDSVEISGAKFPASYTHENRNLTLRGYAVLNYMYVIKAYAGAFYLEEGKGRADALGRSARVLELEYFRNIKGEDFAEDKYLLAKNKNYRHFCFHERAR